MKNKALRTALVSLQFAIAGGCVCVLYVVYVPLALIRVLVDKDGFCGFLDCVGKMCENDNRLVQKKRK